MSRAKAWAAGVKLPAVTTMPPAALAGHDAEQLTHRPHAHVAGLVVLALDEPAAAAFAEHHVHAVHAGRPIDQLHAVGSPAVGLGDEMLELPPDQG